MFGWKYGTLYIILCWSEGENPHNNYKPINLWNVSLIKLYVKFFLMSSKEFECKYIEKSVSPLFQAELSILLWDTNVFIFSMMDEPKGNDDLNYIREKLILGWNEFSLEENWCWILDFYKNLG